MSWRHRVVLAAGAVTLAGLGLLLGARYAREPRYQGRTTAQWFRQLRANAQRYAKTISRPGVARTTIRFVSGNPAAQGAFQVMPPVWLAGPLVVRPPTTAPMGIVPFRNLANYPALYPASGVPQDPAAAALCALGTNAAPWLAGQLRRKDTYLRVTYIRIYGRLALKLPTSLLRFVPDPPDSAEAMRSDASVVLSLLGGNGQAAVPALLQALKAGDPSGRSNAGSPGPPWSGWAVLDALKRLSVTDAQADDLLGLLLRDNRLQEALAIVKGLSVRTPGAGKVMARAIASPDLALRRAAVTWLWPSSWSPQAVTPLLATALKDSDADVRYCAARAFEQWTPPPVAVLPALVEALKGADSELRYLSARALEAWGSNAALARPALEQATNDPSIMVRNVSSRALRKLNGDQGPR